MPEELLGALANRTNQAILGLLAVEPTYPRKIGDLLSLSESEVARRLRHMEHLGLVNGAWAHIGKNVKLYKLTADAVALRFTPEGLRVELSHQGAGGRSVLLNPLVVRVPEASLFVGRESELGALAGEEPVVVVEGMPGIGKSSLLARYAQSQDGRRAVFWHAFRGVESLNWLANRLAVFLAQQGQRALLEAVERGAEPADRRELMLAGIDDPRVLVVLDDVHRIEDDAVKSLVTDAIARVRKGKLVVAGRERPRYDPSLKHVKLLHLDGLADDEVLRFLEQKGVVLDTALLPKVHEEVGGHPLALNLFLETAREQGVQVQALLDRIPERNLEDYLLQEIYTALSDDEREVLGAASAFRTDFALEDLAALTRKNPEPSLLKLRRRLLVQASEDGGYALHEVVRNFFYHLQKNKRDLHEKAASHYLGQGGVEGRLEALHHLLAAGRRDRVLELLEQNLDLKEFDFIDAGYQNLYLSVLELFKEAEVRDVRRWALIEDEKGDIRFHRGEDERALKHYSVAWDHFTKAKDAPRVADLAWKRALALQRLGKRKEALQACAEGLKASPEGLARERLEELKETLGRK